MRHLKKYLGLKSLSKIFGLMAMGLLIASTLLGTACAQDINTSSSAVNSTAVTSASDSFPMTVTDDLGRTVTIEHAPQRIVSLAPSNTEILFDLGLGDKVVGDTTDSTYPDAAKNVTKVGSYADIDIEEVVNLNPDLILAEDIDKTDVIPALEKLGFTVYAVVPHTLDEIVASVATIGRLTGASQAAQPIVTDMQSRIKAITDKTQGLSAAQRPSVLYVLWQDPLMSVGTDTPIYEMITDAGGNSIVQNQTGFPTLSLESVIAANPQVVICNVDTTSAGGDAPLVFMQTEPRLAGLAAETSGRVYGIDASLTNQPIPRIIDGLEWMAAMIHPELFPQFVTEYMSTPFPTS